MTNKKFIVASTAAAQIGYVMGAQGNTFETNSRGVISSGEPKHASHKKIYFKSSYDRNKWKDLPIESKEKVFAEMEFKATKEDDIEDFHSGQHHDTKILNPFIDAKFEKVIDEAPTNSVKDDPVSKPKLKLKDIGSMVIKRNQPLRAFLRTHKTFEERYNRCFESQKELFPDECQFFVKEYKDEKGRNSVAIAALKGMETAVTKLVNAGGNPNAVNEKGVPIIMDVWEKFLKIKIEPVNVVKIFDSLLNGGANPNVKNENGLPLLHDILREYTNGFDFFYAVLATLLVRHKANVNLKAFQEVPSEWSELTNNWSPVDWAEFIKNHVSESDWNINIRNRVKLARLILEKNQKDNSITGVLSAVDSSSNLVKTDVKSELDSQIFDSGIDQKSQDGNDANEGNKSTPKLDNDLNIYKKTSSAISKSDLKSKIRGINRSSNTATFLSTLPEGLPGIGRRRNLK